MSHPGEVIQEYAPNVSRAPWQSLKHTVLAGRDGADWESHVGFDIAR